MLQINTDPNDSDTWKHKTLKKDDLWTSQKKEL